MKSISSYTGTKKRKHLSDEHLDASQPSRVADQNIAYATESIISRGFKRLRVESSSSLNKISNSLRGQAPATRPALAASHSKSGNLPAGQSKVTAPIPRKTVTNDGARDRAKAGRRMSLPGQKTPRRSPRKSAKLQTKRRQPVSQGIQTITRPHPKLRTEFTGGAQTRGYRVPSLDEYSKDSSKRYMPPYIGEERFRATSRSTLYYNVEHQQERPASNKPDSVFSTGRALPRFAAPTASSRAKTLQDKPLPPLPLNVRKRPLASHTANMG
jgi:hypothetical protein